MKYLGKLGNAVVGLDIEPCYIAAVQGGSGEPAVMRAAGAQLAPGIVREGEVVDVPALADALRALFAEHKLERRVRIGVANQRIVVRMLDLPPLSDPAEIASAVRFQAQDQVPMPLDQAVLDHHSLGIVETAAGPRTRVVLVAARRDMIDRLLEATRQAGLRVQGIDLSAFAMIRALHRPGVDDAVLYVSVGGVTNLAVALGTTCVFTRVLTHGVESMAAELAERCALTLEHAHGWLRHVGLLAAPEELSGDPEIVTEARRVLGDGTAGIADDIRNSLDFYTMQEGASSVARMVLTGQALSIPGFCEALSRSVSIPVEVGTVPEGQPGGFGGLDGGRLAVAAGLAIDEVPA